MFVRTPKMAGEALYRSLKARGVLVRHFAKPPIQNWLRITVGTTAQMEHLVNNIQQILEE